MLNLLNDNLIFKKLYDLVIKFIVSLVRFSFRIRLFFFCPVHYYMFCLSFYHFRKCMQYLFNFVHCSIQQHHKIVTISTSFSTFYPMHYFIELFGYHRKVSYWKTLLTSKAYLIRDMIGWGWLILSIVFFRAYGMT